MSTAADYWQDFFENWPTEMSRSGVLVTSFGEQIPFGGFLTKDGLLLIERRTPDNVGARQLVVAYQEIQATKITDVVPTERFKAAGFVGLPAVV